MRSGAYLSEIFASIQGEGARVGERHLFVRFAGCNLRCSYCDTPESLVRVPRCRVDLPGGEARVIDNPVSIETLSGLVAEAVRADPALRMIALTGGEPMSQHAFIAEWLETSPPPLPCLLETHGAWTEGLERVLARIRVVSADIKLPSNSGERALWDEHRDFLVRCAGAGTDTYVKMPIDTGTSDEEVRRGARLVSQTLPAATLFLQPIDTPGAGPASIQDPVLQRLAAVAATEMRDVRLVPQLHKLLGIR